MVLLEKEEQLDGDAIAAFVARHQLPDGSFQGDEWGEGIRCRFLRTGHGDVFARLSQVDSRFSFCALATLCLLGRLDAVDVDKAST